jgi:hypothetical protein
MQKAELELPVKQFHRLYDLLGDLIDYEAEINVFNMENNDIDFLEDIRYELFHQIPDEKTYTDYAVTGRSSNPSILAGKLYKIVEQTSKYGFKLEVEDGEVIYCLFKKCAFLNGRDWTIINVED